MNENLEKLDECLTIMFDLWFDKRLINNRFEEIRDDLDDFIRGYKRECVIVEKERLEKWIEFSKNA